MNIMIDYNTEAPIYEQIYQQIRDSIVQEIILAHDKLPSIRFLAKELQVSVITTKTAYEDLEKEGYIYTVKGKGGNVSQLNKNEIQETYTQEIQTLMKDIIELARTSKISDEDLLKMFKKVKEEK